MPFLWILAALFGQGVYCASDSYMSSCKKEKIAASTKFDLSKKTWDDFDEMMAEEDRLKKKYGERQFNK